MCCYTGLAFIDVQSLEPRHIVEDSYGYLWIEKPRQKTKIMSVIPLLPPALALTQKYSANQMHDDKNYILPIPSNQKMNVYLKEIADLCLIEKSLTTHVARHTFATTIYLTQSLPHEVTAKIIEHSSTRETALLNCLIYTTKSVI